MLLNPASVRAKGNAGFTLVELVVVVAILAVLAGVLTPLVSGEVDDARVVRATTDLKTVTGAFTQYRAHCAAWPRNAATTAVTAATNENLQVFSCLYANTWTDKGWTGPYLNSGYMNGTTMNVAGASDGQGLKDPWGQYYKVYWFPAGGAMGASGGIAVVCTGLNKTVDTPLASIANGTPTGDDQIMIVTRRL